VIGPSMLTAMLPSWAVQMLGGYDAAHQILLVASVAASVPMLVELAEQFWKLNFSVDLLAALSIASALAGGLFW
jgi:hypothetical protein